MEQMYFVYYLNSVGDKVEQRVTDEAHLNVCIEHSKQDWRVDKVWVNKADFCFNGYLVQGDYVGKM